MCRTHTHQPYRDSRAPSKLTGQTTVIKEQITTSGKRASAILGGVSKTMQEATAPAADCGRMPAYAWT